MFILKIYIERFMFFTEHVSNIPKNGYDINENCKLRFISFIDKICVNG
jgi:hypothetical protein